MDHLYGHFYGVLLYFIYHFGTWQPRSSSLLCSPKERNECGKTWEGVNHKSFSFGWNNPLNVQQRQGFVFKEVPCRVLVYLTQFPVCCVGTCEVVRLAAGRGVCVCVMSKVDICPSACSVCSFISSCFTSRSLLNCSTTFFWGRKREQVPVLFFVRSVTRTCNKVSLTHTLFLPAVDKILSCWILAHLH